MADTRRALIKYSVQDVIRILENEPVKADMVPEIMAVQAMNRVAIAHLSIERALKFLIKEAGGLFEETHNLKHRYQELLQHDPVSAKCLEDVFKAAVCHYRYNANAANMTHLKTLERYLEVVGSDKAFQNIRYWELKQSLKEMVLHRTYLSIHIELLHGLRELLLTPSRPTQTVADRVERAVKNAMWPTKDLAYSTGTPKEQSIHSYMKWRQSFSTWSDALADAVQRGFKIGDDFMEKLVRNASGSLLEAADPAVRYFASTLDILPKQPRNVIPCVEWLGPEKVLYGSVKTPGGTHLGFIRRGLDGLWYIDPLLRVAERTSAKATSQTDARSYLAALFTRLAQVSVEGEDCKIRIVREEHDFFQRNYSEIDWATERTIDDTIWTHKVTLWDKDHGIESSRSVRIEVGNGESEGVVHIFEGTVMEVAGCEIYLSGRDFFDVERKDRD